MQKFLYMSPLCLSFNNADKAKVCQINVAISQLTRVFIVGVCDDFPLRAHL